VSAVSAASPTRLPNVEALGGRRRETCGFAHLILEKPVLRARFLSAVVLVPAIFILAYLGGLAWLALILAAGILAWREMVQLLQRAQFTLDRNLGLIFVIGAVSEAHVYGSGRWSMDLLRPLLAGLIILSLIWALYYKGEHATANWGITVASALYLGFLLGHLVSLRQMADGFHWIAYALLLAWAIDTSAYFVGSAWGKHKLWPRISPKKTWEGLAAGSLAALVAGPLLGGWLVGLHPLWGLLLGALVAAVAPFGDFAVSLFKRLAGSKDASHLIPGHGGVLDRLDSLLFIFPVVVYFARLMAGVGIR
jgi:phosphatidate cytidylyltransferase